TPPTLTFGARLPAANANGWNRTNVQLPFTPADALSGVAGTSLGSPLQFTTEGAGLTRTVTVTDPAGNSAQLTSPTINLDKTSPTMSLVAPLPRANVNGWTNSDMTVQWSCADGLSGVVSPLVSQTLSIEGANQSLTGTCVDLADNSASNTRGDLYVDKTPP